MITLAVALAAALLLRIAPWQAADLWFDEVITIHDYATLPTLWDVFAQYKLANNHVLFSALLWAWLRLIDYLPIEWLIRLPSALCSAGVVLIAVLHWRRWLGDRPAIVCGATFVASLVFASFAWQLRGYALSMLLGAMAVSGLMELTAGAWRRGLAWYLPASVLLPLTIPTNVLLIAAHELFLLLAKPVDMRWRRWVTIALLPIALATLLGCAYYLVIWDRFLRVAGRTEGWDSALAVAVHWAVALVAHLGVLVPLVLWQHVQLARQTDETTTVAPVRADLSLAWRMIGPALLVVGVLLVARHPVPFPRTMLVFLPTVTFAVMYACRGARVWTLVHPAVIVAVVALLGAAWQVVSTAQTRSLVAQGQYPQDLLRQYYRGADDIADLSAAVASRGLGDRLVLLVDFADHPGTYYYWRLNGLPFQRVIIANRHDPARWTSRQQRDAILAVQAASEPHARRILQTADQPCNRLEPLIVGKTRSIWVCATD